MFHVKPSQWWTTYWRLRRKLNGYEVAPTPTDCRRAAVLLQLASRSDAASCGSAGDPDRGASIYLEEIVQYGREAFEAELAWRKAHPHVGQER